MRAVRTVAVVVVLGVAVAGCGDSDGGGSEPDGGGSSADVVSAVLGIITTNIDTDTGDGFSDATEGEELTVGDRVKTDATGFAEVTYHDGSWMRVESEATLTIEDLADTESGQVVSTSIDTGEAWNRVRELSEPEDEFMVDTPVASAAVRGTAFAIDCDGDVACTFSVVEGEVLVNPDVGDPVTLTAGQSLTVTAGEPPPAPEEPGVEALSAEPFIAENLELDEDKATVTDNGDGQDSGDQSSDGQDEGAAGSIAGSYVGLQTIETFDAPGATLIGPGVGDSIPIMFDLVGPCTTGAACELTFTAVDAPAESIFVEVEGGSATGRATVTRDADGRCSWSEDWSVELVVDGDRVTGTADYVPQVAVLDCGTGTVRNATFSTSFEASR